MMLGQVKTTATVAVKYVVKTGDTLIGLARRYYNNGSRWTEIARANSITDPTQLKAGRLIFIPNVPRMVYTPVELPGPLTRPEVIVDSWGPPPGIPAAEPMTQNQKTALTIGGALLLMMMLGG